MELTAKQREYADGVVESISKFAEGISDVSFQFRSDGKNRGFKVIVRIYDPYALISSKQFRGLGRYCKMRNWDRDIFRLRDGGKQIDITGYVAV